MDGYFKNPKALQNYLLPTQAISDATAKLSEKGLNRKLLEDEDDKSLRTGLSFPFLYNTTRGRG